MRWLPTPSRRPRPTRSSPTSSARKYRNVPGRAEFAKFQPLPENTELVEKMMGTVAPVMKIQ